MRVQHLYLHVPFCLRRCSYCDFAVQPGRRPDIAGWLDAIARELDIIARDDLSLELSTMYLGGGTPSLLTVGAMLELHRILERYATIDGTAEWTAEANPENLTSELAAEWRAAGVNRLSIGVQTFHSPALRWMGRLHGPEGARAAVQNARSAGFDNLSLDLIFALPENLGRSWSADLQQVIALEPEHVSLYGLSAEPTAALHRWVREGRAALPPEETYAVEYQQAVDALTAAGYEHYEVSNFARPGFESRHNRAYWNGAAYLGLGPSSHSYLPPIRYWNLRDWKQYQGALLAGQSPRESSESLDADALELERIWLGLRQSSGVLLPEPTATQQDALQQWQKAGWASVREGCVTLNAAGWLLLDQLAVQLARPSAEMPGPAVRGES